MVTNENIRVLGLLMSGALRRDESRPSNELHTLNRLNEKVEEYQRETRSFIICDVSCALVLLGNVIMLVAGVAISSPWMIVAMVIAGVVLGLGLISRLQKKNEIHEMAEQLLQNERGIELRFETVIIDETLSAEDFQDIKEYLPLSVQRDNHFKQNITSNISYKVQITPPSLFWAHQARCRSVNIIENVREIERVERNVEWRRLLCDMVHHNRGRFSQEFCTMVGRMSTQNIALFNNHESDRAEDRDYCYQVNRHLGLGAAESLTITKKQGGERISYETAEALKERFFVDDRALPPPNVIFRGV